jgi:sugar phosphate isomerase/epimerase
MKLGFSTLGCPAWNLKQIADFAANSGYDGVELRVHDEGIHLATDASDETVKKVAEIFKKHGSRIFSLLGYSRFTSGEQSELAANRDKLKRLADMAHILGASYIRAFAGVLPESVTHELIVERARPYLMDACEYAGKANVTIAVETHDDWCRPTNLRKLLGVIGPQLGVVWDICNTWLETDLSVEEQYQGLRGSISYCHVKDGIKSCDGKITHLPLGEGSCDIPTAIKLLQKDNQNVFLSFEHEKRWHPELPEPEEALPDFVRRVRMLL